MANRRQFLQLAAGLVVLPFVPVPLDPDPLANLEGLAAELRPTCSPGLYVQTFGRAKRLARKPIRIYFYDESSCVVYPAAGGRDIFQRYLETVKRQEKIDAYLAKFIVRDKGVS